MFNFYSQPRDKQPVIDVFNCRARVGRWRVNADGTFYIDDAANWEDLESAAIEEVEAQGGAVTQSGNNPCPADLFERAVFGD